VVTGGGQPDLSAFQLEVARLFFALPASKDFLLAGGGVLIDLAVNAPPDLPASVTSAGLTTLAGREQELGYEVEVVEGEVVSAGVVDPAQGIATALYQPEVDVQRDVCGD
jgi:hypothetical protein